MKTLTIRRWLLSAWLLYLISSVILFSTFTLLTWHNTAWDTGDRNFSSFPVYISILIGTQVFMAVLISWFLRRALLRPLAAMSKVARQIAGNDLNFQLPSSQVREVAEVALAFEEMGKALQEALERQAALEQERCLFISAVAHDLRTPLFSLRGYLAGLEQGVANTPEKVNRYLKVCCEKANDLEKRVSDLFAYSRLEYLGQTPLRDKVDLRAILDKVLESFSLQLEAKAIKVSLNQPEEADYLIGDSQLLYRVFENLLDNAIRYTPQNGTIWIDWDRQGDEVIFTVADSGIGFNPQYLPVIFRPLYHHAPSDQYQTEGAGLGLTIARRILVAHGGGLSASNRVEGGAELKGWLKCNFSL